MTKPTLRAVGATLFALPLIAVALAAEAEDPPGWGYAGETGPADWGAFSETCAAGTQQSPVDLDPTLLVPGLGELAIAYRAGPVTLVNNGHSVEARLPAGSTLTVDGVAYALLQFHFHSPSEHAVAGRSAPLEIHFVHQAEGRGRAVIGVLVHPGGENETLARLMGSLPQTEGAEAALDNVDPAALLPARRGYYRYAGSLTTPPCTEDVAWFVMQEPLMAENGRIAEFAALYPANARPLQPANRRFFLASPP